MHKVFGKRLTSCEPFLVAQAFKEGDKQYKAGDVAWDGKPTVISLGECKDKKIAEYYAENIRKNVSKKIWKIWVE